MSSERADFAVGVLTLGCMWPVWPCRRTCIEATRSTSNTATARRPPPEPWAALDARRGAANRTTPVIAAEDLAEDTLIPATADGVRMMLYKKGEQLYALSDRCSHRGCPLHLGQVNDLMLECSCHGSIFRLSDGGVVRGPATVPAPTYEVRCQDGKVEIRLTVR